MMRSGSKAHLNLTILTNAAPADKVLAVVC